MPHQCLQCGQLFADGSRDLLKGCSGCGGSKFFFTEEALDADTRSEMVQETDKDVRTMLKDLLAKRERPNYDDGIWSRDAWETWVRSGPAEADDADRPPSGEGPRTPGADDDEPLLDADGVDVWDVPAEAAPAPKRTVQSQLGATATEAPSGPPPSEASISGADPDAVAELAERLGADPDAEPAEPETLRIKQPGQYELDIERLVERAPVIVEKDGVYMVHLPSVFEAHDARRRRR